MARPGPGILEVAFTDDLVGTEVLPVAILLLLLHHRNSRRQLNINQGIEVAFYLKKCGCLGPG